MTLGDWKHNEGLAARDLTCQRSGVTIFSNLSFAVAPGELLRLQGPNGAGKSSLLRLLAGLLPLAAGTLTYTGANVTDDWSAFQEKLHYTGHLDPVKPALTVAENLTFWVQLAGASPDDIRPALKQLGIAGIADIPARFLSAGQRRRLSLARLAAIARPVWLLDEPTVALDQDAIGRFAELTADHLARGGIAIAATHTELGLAHTRILDFTELGSPCAASF